MRRTIPERTGLEAEEEGLTERRLVALLVSVKADMMSS
jgi:hypothetical protein